MNQHNDHIDDLETLRVLKMQEDDLRKLAQQAASLHERQSQLDERLQQLKQRTRALARVEQVDVPQEKHLPTPPTPPEKPKMTLDEVPDWQLLKERSLKQVKGDVAPADLLTRQEMDAALRQSDLIGSELSARTGLTRRDLAFLAVATSIQSTRWMMMPQLIGTIGRGARLISLLSPATMGLLERKPGKQELALADEVNHQFQEEAGWTPDSVATAEAGGYKSWEDILHDGTASSADAAEGAFSNGALNWLFGIINNITGTRTAADFSTVDAITGEAVKTPGIFADAFRSIKDDWMRLPAAVYAQYAREKAAQGEPVDPLAPLADSFSPEMLGDLYISQFTQLTAIEELTLVGQQAAVPLIINMAVGLLHGFMYNPRTDGPRAYYDARTRKILLYSNAMATAANLTLTAASENWAKLDVGGLIVATMRIAQDSAYLLQLEDRFTQMQLDKVLEKEIQEIDSHFLNLPAATNTTQQINPNINQQT